MKQIILLILALASITAVITDLKMGLIKNWLTLPLWAGGLIASFLTGGWQGVVSAIGAGLLVVVTTFRFSTPGGGDIKLGLAVGSWIGVGGWGPYFIGAALTRIALTVAVKLKTYGLKGLPTGLKFELAFNDIPDVGGKNFAVFQQAAGKAGYEGDKPVVPGALWVAGGTMAYIAFSILSGTV